ncbi:hypothetical protein [Bradyrhizobium sp. CCBAU 11434]|uniref:hypothetical protein n=1 Tax=Bradyrhizobium sp. CCBAU 11434 TaxID=1630885 RepID=UPI0023053F5D|nr:hypothetical protein [Bradyrhizobium sp. CCBAU 11434]
MFDGQLKLGSFGVELALHPKRRCLGAMGLGEAGVAPPYVITEVFEFLFALGELARDRFVRLAGLLRGDPRTFRCQSSD